MIARACEFSTVWMRRRQKARARGDKENRAGVRGHIGMVDMRASPTLAHFKAQLVPVACVPSTPPLPVCPHRPTLDEENLSSTRTFAD